jgi:hypothetical protein
MESVFVRGKFFLLNRNWCKYAVSKGGLLTPAKSLYSVFYFSQATKAKSAKPLSVCPTACAMITIVETVFGSLY